MFATTLTTAIAQYFGDKQKQVHTVESGMVIGILVIISSVHLA
jgi:hypothetical protein